MKKNLRKRMIKNKEGNFNERLCSWKKNIQIKMFTKSCVTDENR